MKRGQCFEIGNMCLQYFLSNVALKDLFFYEDSETQRVVVYKWYVSIFILNISETDIDTHRQNPLSYGQKDRCTHGPDKEEKII